MRIVDRALLILTAVLLGGAVAICWMTATPPQNFTIDGKTSPWPLVIAQTSSSIADSLALAGLASGAGLLFLRAARWPRMPAQAEEFTPEPSP